MQAAPPLLFESRTASGMRTMQHQFVDQNVAKAQLQRSLADLARQRTLLASELDAVRQSLGREGEAARAVQASIRQAQQEVQALKAKVTRNQAPGETFVASVRIAAS